jgi:hypothetical protein
MKAGEVHPRRRYQRRKPRHQLQRLEQAMQIRWHERAITSAEQDE